MTAALEHNHGLLQLSNGITIDIIGNPEGNPIVFLCGWGMSTQAYHERLEELGTDFRIYAISLPGFGNNNSPLPLKDTNVPAYALLLAETIEQLALPVPFVIMGHSTGGGIATLIAKDHPEWIRDVILVTPIGSAERTPGATRQLITDWYVREDLTLLDLENLRKNALHATVLAWSATRINLVNDVQHLVDQGTRVHMFLSETDYVAPPGSLGRIDGADIYWVDGGHTWFRYKDNEFTHLVRSILATYRKRPVPPARISAWQRFRAWLSGETK